MMLKAGFVSLGCAKNLVDTQVMLGILAANKIHITNDPNEADILIVNTCSFIESAKAESLTTILQLSDYKNNGKCKGLIVAGCLGEQYKSELLDEMPEVSAIVGTGAWHRIMEAVTAALNGERVLILGDNDVIYDETMPRINTMPFYSAYVKIAEGCDNCCSYCLIPSLRGKFRSRKMESVVNEVKGLVDSRVKEINLIAQDTTSYGKDIYGTPSLPALLKELVKIDGEFFIRLLYCYPKYFSNELIEIIRTEPKICKYVDLPLQHAHNDILKRMNRKGGRRSIETLILRIRKKIPSVVIRTSFIVGFPGETEEHFNSLKEFILAKRFEKVGIFIYSREDGTIAANSLEQIPDEIKEARYHELMSLQCKISEEINVKKGEEGLILDVLIEEANLGDENITYGRSYGEAPEVDGRIYIENAPKLKPGDIVKVKIVQGFTYDLLGVCI